MPVFLFLILKWYVLFSPCRIVLSGGVTISILYSTASSDTSITASKVSFPVLPIATKVTSSLAPSAAKVSDVTITLTVFFPPLDMETDSELISISHASFSSSEKPDVVILTVSSS